MNAFRSTTYPQHVIFGAGSAGALGAAIDKFGWQRLILCTSPSQRRSGKVDKVEALLGQRLLATVDDVEPHVQEEQLATVVELATRYEADAIVALGGGSSLGIAKATADALTLSRNNGENVPNVAIPTTYAGSEMTPIYGVTRQVHGVKQKQTVRDPRFTPRLVIYDPELTLDVPPDLTATSSINALAHCFEALYSLERSPLGSAAALRGLSRIGTSLPICHKEPDNLNARTDLLEGTYLAGCALAQISVALHHGLCHVLGGTAGVPHGVANTIVLPHALRFNREAAAVELAGAAVALNIATPDTDELEATDLVIAWVEELQKELNVPTRLRDANVPSDLLPRLAEIAAASKTMTLNPQPIDSSAQMEVLLERMW